MSQARRSLREEMDLAAPTADAGGVRRGAMGGGAGGGVRAWGVVVFFGTAGLAMDGSAVA